MKKAFTLIELLVVVSIISLLSSIVLYSVSEARIEAQDGKKKEEVRQVGLAMKLREEANNQGLLSSGSVSYNTNTAYVESSDQYQEAMSNLVDSGTISQIPASPNGGDYFYMEDDEGNGVFGTILRSGDSVDENGGCEFSDDDYSCDADSGAPTVIDRALLVEESDSCVNDGICSGVSGGGSGSDVATDESCFTFSGGTITDYDEANCSLDVVIPSTIGGETVTSVGGYTFQNNNLTSVSFPNSLTSIGNWAFQNNDLTSVSFPSGVTSIGHISFSSNQITSVSIPESVTFIGNGAFTSNQLTSISIPSGVTFIGNFTFQNNDLTSVTIPGNVTSIGSGAFQGNNLTSVSIPGGVSTIGSTAFRYNQLTSLYLPDSVTNISSYAFGDNNLTSVDMSSGTSYMSNTFYNNNCTVDNGCINLR